MYCDVLRLTTLGGLMDPGKKESEEDRRDGFTFDTTVLTFFFLNTKKKSSLKWSVTMKV